MKRIMFCMLAMLVALVLVTPAQATLITRGTGTSVHGTFNLIYDDDLDITWYDFTNGPAVWEAQRDWALGLSVDFGGIIYDDWRLPTTVDDSNSFGYNITNSEMGHLYYDNDALNIDGGGSLYNLDNFEHLISSIYFSGTKYMPNSLTISNDTYAWRFGFSNGFQGTTISSSTSTGWQFVPAMLPPLCLNPRLLPYSESVLLGWQPMV